MTARDGAAVARRAHNPKVGGSNPSPATKIEPTAEPCGSAVVRPPPVAPARHAPGAREQPPWTADGGTDGRGADIDGARDAHGGWAYPGFPGSVRLEIMPQTQRPDDSSRSRRG